MNFRQKQIFIWKYAANSITCSRILLSFSLLFLESLSIPFLIVYLMCGISDMLDGIVARKTMSTSKVGEKLDSIADIIFLVVAFYKIIPFITISIIQLLAIIVIALIRIYNMIYSFYRHKRIQLLHTTANKITGFMLFVLPILMYGNINFNILFLFLSVIATYASIQEGYFLRYV